MKTWSFVLTCATVALAILIRMAYKTYGLIVSREVRFTDQKCKLVGEDVIVGSEDLALGKGGILFITSGDLRTTFQEGAASAEPGSIFALDMRGSSSKPVRILLRNFPAGVRFQPHGLHVSNSSDHLLTTSHAGDHSRIEIFRIEYHPKCFKTQPWSCSPASLYHVNSIVSDYFPNCGINDVVEGSSKYELYTTQWLIVGYPENGLDFASKFETEIIPLFMNLIGFSWTRVYRCTWSEGVLGGNCEPATWRQFSGANGITISLDKTQIYVNDPIEKRISIMDRQEDGMLVESGHIDLPWLVDNIEMDGDEIVMGSVPYVGKALEIQENHSKAIPGGILVARRKGAKWKADKYHMIVHDGTKLAQISAASRWGSKVVLGSPFSRGVLVCHCIDSLIIESIEHISESKLP